MIPRDGRSEPISGDDPNSIPGEDPSSSIPGDDPSRSPEAIVRGVGFKAYQLWCNAVSGGGDRVVGLLYCLCLLFSVCYGYTGDSRAYL